MKFSAVIVIHSDDEATYLKSIGSVEKCVDEIIVADIGMTEDMVRTVKKIKNATYEKVKKPVPYVELIRQKFINKASGDWIIYLDPDEEFSKQLNDYVLKHADKADYFAVPRMNMILRHWMEHSRWWPDYQFRVFKKGHVTWSTTIHAQPKTKGTKHEVPADKKYALIHHNYISYDQYLNKARRYARAEAEELVSSKVDFSVVQGLKRGVSEFVSRFFKDEGYKDGTHGFVMAFSQLVYYFQVYVYYWEMKGYPESKPDDIAKVPGEFFTHALHESLHWSRAKKIVTDPISKVKSAILKRL